MQKVTKRIHTLDEVTINVKLLTEMLSHYNKDRSSNSDKDIIKVCVRVPAHTHMHPYMNLNQIFNLQGRSWNISLSR